VNASTSTSHVAANAFDFRADPIERLFAAQPAAQPAPQGPTHRVFIAAATGPATITHRAGYR